MSGTKAPEYSTRVDRVIYEAEPISAVLDSPVEVLQLALAVLDQADASLYGPLERKAIALLNEALREEQEEAA